MSSGLLQRSQPSPTAVPARVRYGSDRVCILANLTQYGCLSVTQAFHSSNLGSFVHRDGLPGEFSTRIGNPSDCPCGEDTTKFATISRDFWSLVPSTCHAPLVLVCSALSITSASLNAGICSVSCNTRLTDFTGGSEAIFSSATENSCFPNHRVLLPESMVQRLAYRASSCTSLAGSATTSSN